MGKKTQPYKLGLPQKYTAGAKNKARQAKVIKRGQAAYKKGERLPDSYFKERTAIGGASLDVVGEKIKKLLDEGMPRKQAIAVALSMKERGELK